MGNPEPTMAERYREARTIMKTIGLSRVRACEKVTLKLSTYDFYRKLELAGDRLSASLATTKESEGNA